MRYDHDLIIVGGGLAGNCLALALKDSGLRVALIEAETDIERERSPIGQRALALAYGSTVMLAALDLWETINKTATPIKHIHISDQGHFGKTRLSAEKEGVEALGYVITAHQIESHVSKQASQTGLTVYCPARVVGLMSSDEATYLNINVDKQSVNLTAKLVVGADGGQSTVRDLLGIKQKITGYSQKAIVTTIRSSLGHKYVAYERFTTQ
jgi:2-octaprenyl-6-methoxyphenol hydroxylase